MTNLIASRQVGAFPGSTRRAPDEGRGTEGDGGVGMDTDRVQKSVVGVGEYKGRQEE